VLKPRIKPTYLSENCQLHYTLSCLSRLTENAGRETNGRNCRHEIAGHRYFSNLPASATMSQVYDICSPKFFVPISMQAALRLKDLCNVRQWPSRRERLILTTATRGRHSNVMLFADLINVYACDNSDNSI